MTVNIISFILYKEALVDEKWLFRGINIMIWTAIAHFAYYVLDELKTILGIRIFHVTPKKKTSWMICSCYGLIKTNRLQ